MTGLDNVELHLVNDLDTADKLMAWLGERHDGEIAFDTETSGLSPETDVVRLAQIGDSRQGWAIPWERWGGVFEEAITKYEGRLLGHNTAFDVAMLASSGFDVPTHRCEDTRLMCYVLEPLMSTALKRAATRHVDQRAGALQADLGLSHSSTGASKQSGWTWGTVPVDYEPYWSYAALDCVLTSQLYGVLRPRLELEGSVRAYDLELATSWVANRMERNGFLVDRPFAAEQHAKMGDRIAGIEQQVHETYGCSPSQNGAVAERLIADGIPLSKTTTTGAIQMDKAVLFPYAGHPLVDAVLAHRRLTKMRSTYLSNFLDLTTDADPRLRPRINSAGISMRRLESGTRTGRMSMDTPNLQNLPRRDKDDENVRAIRNCLVAQPGHTLLLIDFDQIEMRILAHLTHQLGDDSLRDAFLSPDDFFVTLARQVFNDPTIDKKHPLRDTIKSFGYGTIYGAGDDKMAQTTGLPAEQAGAAIRAFKSNSPGIDKLQHAIEQMAMQRAVNGVGRPYVRSQLTGRRWYLSDGDGLYVLLNYVHQGTAGEILKMKMIELAAAGLDKYLILPVHDEVIFEVPDDEIQDVARTASAVMQDDTLLSVPITAGVSKGLRWGQKEDYTPCSI